MSQVLAGPYCAMLLGDLGCDVIKIEPPGTGDSSRHSLGEPQPWGETGAFLAVNRNKRSVTLSLKAPRGREVFERLARTADVVIESYRPGTTDRLGVGYEALSAVNPRLVYASVSGFGATGPYRGRGGYDIIAQGHTGIMSATGEPDGPPAKAGVALTDTGAGLFCAIAILAALIARERTGRGQHVDTSLFEAGLAFGVWETTELWWSGRIPQRLGSAHRMSAPYQAVRTSDGYITIGAFTDKLWGAAAAALGHPEWTDDPRFSVSAARLENRDALIAAIEEVTAGTPSADVVERLVGAGVPAGPVANYAQAVDDPQTLAREMIVTADHPLAGTIKMIGTPFKMSGTPTSVRRPPPTLGQHNEEVLRELGYDEAEIDELRRESVI